MAALEPYESLIRELIEEKNFTHQDVRNDLACNFLLERGCSARNVRAFCTSRNIHRFDNTRMSQPEIDDKVKQLVDEVSTLDLI